MLCQAPQKSHRQCKDSVQKVGVVILVASVIILIYKGQIASGKEHVASGKLILTSNM